MATNDTQPARASFATASRPGHVKPEDRATMSPPKSDAQVLREHHARIVRFGR